MVNVGQEQEKERLGKLYEAMSEEELRKLASDAAQLTDEARQVLSDEIAHRALDIFLTGTQQSNTKSRPSSGALGFQHWSLAHFSLAGVRRWQLSVVLLSFVVAVTSLWTGRRKAHLDDLYRTAISTPDTVKARAALNELATYRGDYANQLVVRIATTNNPLDINGIQESAIKLLSERGDPRAAEQIAQRLHPYEGLAIRHAVAESLTKLPCSPECVRLVLDYEERVWRGDPVPENILVKEQFPETVNEQQEVDRQLRVVLLHQRTDTLRALAQTYGLGDIAVSPFGLYTVVQLKLTDGLSSPSRGPTV